jgi:hypothetical protein
MRKLPDMPSSIIGAQSGGVPLVSGFWQQNAVGAGGVFVANSSSSSGSVFFGLSGGVTLSSGGALASGGMLDGCELRVGTSVILPPAWLRSGNNDPFSLVFSVPAAISGQARVFWEPLN